MTQAYRPDRELAGKVALITGGSRNIGRGVARALAAGGASVMVNASKSEAEAQETVELIRRGGGTAAYCMADVTDPRAVEALVSETVRRFGRLDLLSINQTLRASAPIERLPYSEFRRVVEVSLDGTWLCCKAAAPHVASAGGGSIVIMGGTRGVMGSPGGSHVSAGKSALVGLTRSLARELADRRITVNCIHPVLIDTARVAPGDAQRGHETTLIGRMGTVDEVAALVRFLCGPDGGYITGQNIFVNGGVYMP
jgi:3-oxoacyl-[acyl-carrier protein] reductase